MKRLIAIFAFVISISFLTSSCEKCSSCQYAYKLAGEDTSRVYPETCGSSKELDAFEATVNADAAADNGAVATCTRKK